MKTRSPSRPAPASRQIKRFEAASPGPHHNPPKPTPPTASNATAARAVRTAKNPPGIDPRQRQN
ncbi:hypothetical protein ACVWZR_007761 [Bradyrhizobium sp. i1.3.1]